MFVSQAGGVYGGGAQSLSVSRIAGAVVKWLIFLVFLIAATNFLGWPLLTDLLNQIILFIPNLIVAALILILAPIGGRLLRTAIEEGTARAGVSSGRLVGRIAEIAVILFGVVIAVNQIGIASGLVNILFTGMVVALAIAFGLAFGLGGREVAGQVLQGWYDSSREAAGKLAAAANAQASNATEASMSAGNQASTGTGGPGRKPETSVSETATAATPPPATS